MKLLIIAGTGQNFGQGHIQRMSELEHTCFLRGHETWILPYENESSLNARKSLLKQADLILIDARDLDPVPFSRFAPVLTLDNRGKHRTKNRDREVWEANGEPYPILYYDTLFHPEHSDESIRRVCPQILISPELVQMQGRVAADMALLFYPGTLPVAEGLTDWLVQLSRAGIELLVFDRDAPGEWDRFGRRILSQRNGGFTLHRSFDRTVFFRELARSRLVLSHPGMTIYESWFTGNIPVVRGGSPVHDLLAEDLHRRPGFPYLKLNDGGWAQLWNSQGEKMEIRGPGDLVDPSWNRGDYFPPDGRGFDRLLEEMESLARKNGQ